MIVKNEERYLRDCLNALRPVLEQVESELIIVDSGSTDKTLEIAREFTDKIYEIQWRGDFAWARNEALKHSRGKWVLAIDGDEIMQDSEDLIIFFNSGEYSNYNFALIAQRNLDAGGAVNNFTDMARLFKLGKNIKWEGKIHETIFTELPGKHLKTSVLHYGYVFEDDESRIAKHKRNVVPLLEEYKEQPNNPRTIMHLINEYRVAKDTEKTMEFIKRGLELTDAHRKNEYFRGFSNCLVEHHHRLEEHEETVDAVKDYFKKSKIACISDILMWIRKMQSELKLQKYEDAAASGVACYPLFDKKDAGQLDIVVAAIYQQPSEELTNRTEVAKLIAIAFLLNGDFAEAFDWLKKLEAGKHEGVFDYAILSIIKEKEYEKLGGMYNYTTSHGGVDSLVYGHMVRSIERYTPNAGAKKAIAQTLLAQSIVKDDYLRLQELRATGVGLDYFLKIDHPLAQYYGDVMLASMRANADFTAFFARLELTNSIEFVGNIIRTNSDCEKLVLEHGKKWVGSNPSIKFARVMSILMSTLYSILEAKTAAAEPSDKQVDMFEISSRMRHLYLSMTYRDEIYCEGHVSELSEDDRFTFYVGGAYSLKDAGDAAGFARGLRLALPIKPQMKYVFSTITDRLQQELGQATSVRQELAELKSALKGMIHNLINIGDLPQAAAVLEMYAADNADDPDIPALRAAINKHQ